MGANKQKIKKDVRDEFAPYLNDFKERVLDRMEEQLTDRLDELIDKEDRVIRSARNVNTSATMLRHSLEKFKESITFYVIGFGLLSSMLGSFITFVLLWFFW